MWDPEVIAAKQRALVQQIYTEHMVAPDWHPKLRPPPRPTWLKLIPSAAALSYNFAVEQYQPHSEKNKKFRSSWSSQELAEAGNDDFGKMKLSDGFSPHHYSYNLGDF